MLIISQKPSATTNRPTAAKEPASYSSMHATSDQPAFEAIIHTPRRAFNRPASARGRIERVRSSSRGSADNSAARSGSQLGDPISPVSEATLLAAPPREYIATDVSVLSSAILNKRFDSQFANLRVHVEYSAYLVSTGHSLRYDPEKYKACFVDLEQLVAAELKAFNVKVISNKLSFIGVSGPRPGSFEVCLLWDVASSKNKSQFCNMFSKLRTRR